MCVGIYAFLTLCTSTMRQKINLLEELNRFESRAFLLRDQLPYKFKEPNLPYKLPIADERILFPKSISTM